MSFAFEWPRFSQEFHTEAKQLLDAALNKGNKPPIIADRIEVVDLEMGTEPPELEVRDIGELTVDQFRGIFRLTYAGDAHIVLRTKVQANPLNHKGRDIHDMTGSVGILAAHRPLVVPMLLRLSNFRLSAYVVLVMSRQKGITLVFKTDPLQNVDVNSTFDSIAVIQKYIQKEIEGQLRNMFREDLPSIIHRLSQRWLVAQTEKQVQIETSYRLKTPSAIPVTKENLSALSRDEPPWTSPNSRVASTSTRHLARRISSSRLSTATAPISKRLDPEASRRIPPPDSESSVFPDIENFDPTYGLRPEAIPNKSDYSDYADLFGGSKGLGDLMEDRESDQVDQSDVESSAFAFVDWDDTVSDPPPSPPVSASPAVEYETLPAVGGGTITRPRIYHAQSMAPPSFLPEATASSSTATAVTMEHHKLLRPGITPLIRTASLASQTLSAFSDRSGSGPLRRLQSRHHPRIIEPHTNMMHQSTSLPQVPQSSHSGNRRAAIPPLAEQDSLQADFDVSAERKTAFPPNAEDDIVLRPSLNENISYLSVLSHSHQTLSPYTRSVEHFTVRSGPPREVPPAHHDKPPVKARRKRMYKLGSSLSPQLDRGLQLGDPERRSLSPSPPSDCELSDVEHYFPSPSHLFRQRHQYQLQ